jgi:hypothetical protein
MKEGLNGPTLSAANEQMLRKFGAGYAVVQLVGKLVPVIAGHRELLETVHKGMTTAFEQLESFLEERFDRLEEQKPNTPQLISTRKTTRAWGLHPIIGDAQSKKNPLTRLPVHQAIFLCSMPSFCNWV